MENHRSRTKRIESSTFSLGDGGVYIHAATPEDRTRIAEGLPGRIPLTHSTRHSAKFLKDGREVAFNLRDAQEVRKFLGDFSERQTYLDITGMPYSVWAPLIKSGFAILRHFKVVYVEPIEYRRSPAPSGSGEMFDLSEKTEGISPLAGFARLAVDDDTDSVFVALLGFEGVRILHILENLELMDSRIIPVVPAPGFRMEYPSCTVACNSQFIDETKSWSNIKYVGADDPFELYEELQKISRDRPGDLIRVALGGTRPHALGAILFAIQNQERVELVFDHPIERQDRASGVGRAIVYDLEGFVPR